MGLLDGFLRAGEAFSTSMAESTREQALMAEKERVEKERIAAAELLARERILWQKEEEKKARLEEADATRKLAEEKASKRGGLIDGARKEAEDTGEMTEWEINKRIEQEKAAGGRFNTEVTERDILAAKIERGTADPEKLMEFDRRAEETKESRLAREREQIRSDQRHEETLNETKRYHDMMAGGKTASAASKIPEPVKRRLDQYEENIKDYRKEKLKLKESDFGSKAEYDAKVKEYDKVIADNVTKMNVLLNGLDPADKEGKPSPLGTIDKKESPKDFPKVSSDEQLSRDKERLAMIKKEAEADMPQASRDALNKEIASVEASIAKRESSAKSVPAQETQRITVAAKKDPQKLSTQAQLRVELLAKLKELDKVKSGSALSPAERREKERKIAALEEDIGFLRSRGA